LRVLVTRPAGQAQRLCGLLEAAGHECVRLPTIEIQPAADPYRLEAIADTLEDYDLAVFVSVNAVQMGLEPILDQRDWPEHTQIATVGARSAEALTAYGLSVDLVPEHRFNSEALLALEELEDMSGRNVVIFRGNGGREVLRDTLLERGAEVEYVEVYRRVCPALSPATRRCKTCSPWRAMRTRPRYGKFRWWLSVSARRGWPHSWVLYMRRWLPHMQAMRHCLPQLRKPDAAYFSLSESAAYSNASEKKRVSSRPCFRNSVWPASTMTGGPLM
jgi:uroporphyrinogen-III synthase